MTKAQELVRTLLDDIGTDVEVEYSPLSIDSMPHVAWLIRATGSNPTQYLGRGTGHNRQDAEQQVNEKVRLAGLRVVNVVDRAKNDHN